MIDLHIRFTSGEDMFRTVWRVDVDKDSARLVIFDTPDQKTPEQIVDARVEVYMGCRVVRVFIV